MIDESALTAGQSDVPALQKGLRVLEVLAENGGMSSVEIERATGLNKAMVFRILRALRNNGYVELNEATRLHSLGLRFLGLGSAVSSRLDIVRVSKELLDNLRDEHQETINLGTIRDAQVIYLAMAESQRSLRMSTSVGRRDSIHSTSIGKSMLAWMKPAERDQLVRARPLSKQTTFTITNVATLLGQLDVVRDRGYAIDDEESELGARCIGVPILDSEGQPIAALSVSGPASRMVDDRLPQWTVSLWSASRTISQRLGFTHNTSWRV